MDEEKDLLEEYEKLSIPDKRRTLGKTISEMTIMTEKLLNDLNQDYKPKKVDEYYNLFDGNISEEEYLNGLYEDVLDLQEAMGKYYSFSTSLYYESKTENN